MTITVVCDILGEENNGTAVAAMNLIRYLRKQNYDVRVLCTDQTKLGADNFFVVPNRSFGKALNAIVRRVGVSLAKTDKSIVSASLDGADHVHIMMPLGLGMAAAKAAHERGITITAGFHMQAENLTSYIKMSRWRPVNTFVYKYIYKHVYRYVDGIHYPTEFIRRVFEKRIKRKTSGFVISNGVQSHFCKRDVKKPDEYDGKTVILSTGRYSTEKSQDTLIKAVACSKHRDSIQLILAGQGIKEKRYKKLAKKLPVSPIFKLYDREELVEVLSYCDLYVHPAVAELEGIACLESIACGNMTIVSDSANSATRDFAIDNSCVFKHKDCKDLARVIDYWIEHPDERAEYERKYAQSAVVLDQEDCMRKMENMILSLHAKKSAVPEAETAAASADGDCDADNNISVDKMRDAKEPV